MDYEAFSHIIEADDPHFNEIWDENTSYQEEKKEESVIAVSISDSEETKEESLLALSIADSGADADLEERTRSEAPIPMKATPILKRLANPPTNHKPENVTISFVMAEDQSVVSTISKSTYNTNPSTIDIASVLIDSPLDRDLSDLTTTMRIKPMKPPKNDSVENGVFLNLYESMISQQALTMPKCVSNNKAGFIGHCTTKYVNNDNVVENKADITRHFTKVSHSNAITTEGYKQDQAPSEPKENTTEDQNHETTIPQSTPKPYIDTFFMDSEPIVSLPELLASTASQFLSSSLSVDGMSNVSIYADENNNDKNEASDSLEKISVDDAVLTPNLPAVTLEEKRLDERNLLDSLSPDKLQDETAASDEGSSCDDKNDELVEEENVTEGLGLILPAPLPITPHAAQPDDPQDESQETHTGKIEGKSQQTHLGKVEVERMPRKTEGVSEETPTEKIQAEVEENCTERILLNSQEINEGKIQVDPQETHPGKIEVDEAGKILIDDEIDSVESSSIHDHLRDSGEIQASPWDVYISYRIETNQSEDYMSLSDSSVCTPPKQSSGLKARFKPKWKINMKVFSGNKDKKKGGKKIRRQTSKSIHDSPTRTIETYTTATTASTTTTTAYANMAFAAEFPVGRRSLPNFIRPKIKA